MYLFPCSLFSFIVLIEIINVICRERLKLKQDIIKKQREEKEKSENIVAFQVESEYNSTFVSTEVLPVRALSPEIKGTTVYEMLDQKINNYSEKMSEKSLNDENEKTEKHEKYEKYEKTPQQQQQQQQQQQPSSGKGGIPRQSYLEYNDDDESSEEEIDKLSKGNNISQLSFSTDHYNNSNNDSITDLNINNNQNNNRNNDDRTQNDRNNDYRSNNQNNNNDRISFNNSNSNDSNDNDDDRNDDRNNNNNSSSNNNFSNNNNTTGSYDSQTESSNYDLNIHTHKNTNNHPPGTTSPGNEGEGTPVQKRRSSIFKRMKKSFMKSVGGNSKKSTTPHSPMVEDEGRDEGREGGREESLPGKSPEKGKSFFSTFPVDNKTSK